MKKHCFFAGFMCLCVGACTSNPEVDPDLSAPDALRTAYVTVPDTARCITTATIENVARLFPSPDDATRSEERTIEEVLTVAADDGTPLYYIVNYADNQGYMIVSATKDYMPVLAYGDKRRFDPDEAAQTGASLWLAEQRAIVSSADALPDSVKMFHRAVWRQYNTQKRVLDLPPATRGFNEVMTLVHNNVLQWQSEGYTVYSYADYKNSADFRSLSIQMQNDIESAVMIYANPYYGGKENVSFVLERTTATEELVGPLVQSHWGQTSGYNYYVPGGGALGCTVVAAGQIMRYHRYPENLSWDQMDNTFPSGAAARFLYDLGCRIGVDYEHGSNGAYLIDVLSALKSFGYTNAKIENHDANHVLGQLRWAQPVIFNGYYDTNELGHTWVCDGFRRTCNDYQFMIMTLEGCPMGVEPKEFVNPYTLRYEKNISTYFNMNWGDYGRQDGFCLDSDLVFTFINDQGESQTENFNKGRQNIIDIVPVE